VLAYASPRARSPRQSWWGIVSLASGAVAALMLLIIVLTLRYGAPYGRFPSRQASLFNTFVMLTILGTVPTGIVTGVVGLAQRRRARGMAMWGLALCMPVLFIVLGLFSVLM